MNANRLSTFIAAMVAQVTLPTMQSAGALSKAKDHRFLEMPAKIGKPSVGNFQGAPIGGNLWFYQKPKTRIENNKLLFRYAR
ncbi:hypothetical protein O9929_08135 [Vibrio lentus]|nr:hypothetical protein [Vibrio lentus]